MAKAKGLLDNIVESAKKKKKEPQRNFLDIVAEIEGASGLPEGPGSVTRTSGEVITSDPLRTYSPKGYLENPIADIAIGGGYGDQVSKQSISAEKKRMAHSERYRAMQENRGGGSSVTTTVDTSLPTMEWDDLQGRPVIMLPADRTIAGGLLTKIGGLEIDPLPMTGGPHFADLNKAWASDKNAAAAKQRHAMKVAEETGQMPVMIYAPMDHAGSNFSVHPILAQLRYLEASGDLDAAGKAQLDQIMRSLIDKGDTRNIAANWPGYTNARDMMDLVANRERVADLGFSAGNLRKAMTPILGQQKMQMHGALPLNDVYAAVNEPSLHYIQPRGSGMRGLLSKFSDPKDLQMTAPGQSDSYSHLIPAEGAVQIAGPMTPAQVIFRDMFQRRSDKPPAQAYRSVQTSGDALDYQTIDQETLDRIKRYHQTLEQQ